MPRITIVNPQVSRAPAKRARKNPGTISVLGLLNPTRKVTAMKNTAKKAAPKRAIKKHNPFVHKMITAKAKTNGHRRRRSNPEGIVKTGTSIVKNGFLALAGLVATRQIPQMVLGAQNTGIYGYASNLAVIVGSTYLAHKMLGKEAAMVVGIGGAAYVVDRILSENFAPVSSLLSLSGYGDFNAHSKNLSGYESATFFRPQLLNADGSARFPASMQSFVDQRVTAALPAAPKSSRMAGLRRAA